MIYPRLTMMKTPCNKIRQIIDAHHMRGRVTSHARDEKNKCLTQFLKLFLLIVLKFDIEKQVF